MILGAAATGAAILLVGVGFLAGTQFGDRDDTTRLVSGQGDRGSYDRQGPFGGDRQDGPFGPGERGFRDGDGGLPSPGDGVTDAAMTVGQITAIKDSALTVHSMRGNTVTVTTSSSTVIDGKTGGDLAGLSVGETIFATGALKGDRTLVATRISTAPGGMGHGRGLDDGSGGGNSQGRQPGDSQSGAAQPNSLPNSKGMSQPMAAGEEAGGES